MDRLIPPGEEDEWVAEAYNAVSRPLRSAGLFYALYWLQEMKDEDAAAFDYMQMRGELYRAFQVYGVASLVKELTNANKAFYLQGDNLGHYKRAEDGPHPHGRERVEEMVTEKFPEYDGEYMTKILWEASASIPGQRRIDDAGMMKLLNYAEAKWEAKSNPERFLNHIEALYSLGTDQSRPQWGWMYQYGGEAWAGIARHLMRSTDFTKTAWVNQSFAVQHNNAVWLDKVHVPAEHRRRVTEVYQDLRATAARQTIDKLSQSNTFQVALAEVLDERKRGNLEPVFAYAFEFTDELDVNLRRLGRRHGMSKEDVEAYSQDVRIEMRQPYWAAVVTALRFIGDVGNMPMVDKELREKVDPITTQSTRADDAYQIANHITNDWTLSWPDNLGEGNLALTFEMGEARTLRDLVKDALDGLTMSGVKEVQSQLSVEDTNEFVGDLNRANRNLERQL